MTNNQSRAKGSRWKNIKSKTWLMIGGVALLLLALAATAVYFYSFREFEPPVYAFASARSGNGDIFILDREGQLQNLTPNPQADWDPSWSPDGARLAFTSHRSGNSDIWLLDLAEGEGAEPRNLTEHLDWDYGATWSNTGQSIAFVSERDGDPEIFVQNLETDTALQLTFNEEMDRLPAWSPDGKLIAFAAIRGGMEQIHLVRPDGTDEQVATPPPLQGTAPAWSPDSQRLAFVGWDSENRAGIYLIGPNIEDIEKIYEVQGWLGSLNWSADGQWLTFTTWENGNHEIYALPITGGIPIRLTFDQAWDDFLAVNPKTSFTPASEGGIAQAAPANKLPPRVDFAAGVNIADLSLAYLISDLGFDWGKGYLNWATVEPEPGQFRWVDPDNIVKAFSDQEAKILMRIHGTPAWARPQGSALSHPPEDMAAFGKFMTAVALRYKGKVAAYEIWNEPNLTYEWGNLSPDPALYTKMLKTAYTAIKAVDPEALVISGGLATTGEGSPTAYGDLAFLEGMYQAGAKGYFDALGSHPYSFGKAPAEVDPWGLSFSRVVEQYEVMSRHGDGATPVWITELGWAVENQWDLGEHEKYAVTEEQQAQYLAEAYLKARQEWPFVQAIFLFNLDFSTVSWYPAAEPMRWFAILNPDRTPRPAYIELRRTMRTP
jgi:polysaccharide biosynthesis protein PslG